MDFLGARGLGPCLFPDPLDRLGVERADLVGAPAVEHAAGQDRLRAPLLQGGVVQERIGL